MFPESHLCTLTWGAGVHMCAYVWMSVHVCACPCVSVQAVCACARVCVCVHIVGAHARACDPVCAYRCVHCGCACVRV